MTETDMAAKQEAKQQQGESWGELAKTVIYAGLIAIVITHEVELWRFLR